MPKGKQGKTGCRMAKPSGHPVESTRVLAVSHKTEKKNVAVAEQEEVFSLCANESAKVGSKITNVSYGGTLRREASLDCLKGRSIALDVRLLAGEHARQVEAIIECEDTSPLLP